MTTPVPGIQTDHPTDPEDRLALNRATLRQRLARLQTHRAPGALGALDQLARTALPLARRVVAENPYTSLGGGMLAGMILMYWKPWRSLSGSVLIGLLARQALALVPSPGAHAFNWLMAAAHAGHKPIHPARASRSGK
jgi:hypothetical protein